MTFHRESDTRRHRRPGRCRPLTNPEGIPYGSPGLVRSGGPTLGTGIGSAQPCRNPLQAVGRIPCHPRVGGAPRSATRQGRPWHAYARSQCNGLRRDCVWPRLFPGKAAQQRQGRRIYVALPRLGPPKWCTFGAALTRIPFNSS